MKYRLDFHEDIAKDYLQAYTWYESNKVDLGERFLMKVREKLEQIAINPEDYKLYKKEKVVFINSVIHQKKHPRKRHRK